MVTGLLKNLEIRTTYVFSHAYVIITILIKIFRNPEKSWGRRGRLPPTIRELFIRVGIICIGRCGHLPYTFVVPPALSTNPSVLLTLIAVFLALLTSSETERYYCRLGMKPLIECDSIVTVKFDPNIPGIRCEDFAFRIECLDENYFSFHSRFDLKMTLIERSPTCSG
jgi:hypothetical protein